jgi:hypothetical protein
MRATKLLSVSVALWAVVVGADGASAGGVNVPIVRPSVTIKPIITPPRIKPGTTGGTVCCVIKNNGGWTVLLGGGNGQATQSHHHHQAGGTLQVWGTTNGQPTTYSQPATGGAGSPSGGAAAGTNLVIRRTGGVTDVGGEGSGEARPARNYAPPASYNSKTACGRYPYPACQ